MSGEKKSDLPGVELSERSCEGKPEGPATAANRSVEKVNTPYNQA